MRVALTVLLPLLLPSIVYFSYVALARQDPRSAEAVPWFWLLVSGLVLALTAFVLLSVFEGAAPGSVYHPPRAVDGRIEPGYFGPEKQPNSP